MHVPITSKEVTLEIESLNTIIFNSVIFNQPSFTSFHSQHTRVFWSTYNIINMPERGGEKILFINTQ